MTLEILTILILLLPLCAAAGITLFTQRSKTLSAALSVGAVITGFVLSVLLVATNGWTRFESGLTWLELDTLRVEFGFNLDPLSLIMLLVVTGVGSVIHVYSLGYMRGDPGWSRYFACLSLFTFSMLGIVLANNFILMFIFWELVGVSSYLLIGFWFERPAAADAAKKAFLTNRLGDFGFMLGILIVWATLGSIHFATLKETVLANPTALGNVATLAGLLIFCGAVGKSAQFPLHVWLPDAMEGPTPVSALIHAATMVAAGVYMLCRVNFIFTPAALAVIAWVGGFTALLAALIATQQNDIKRVLAYSTISQLAYMMMAIGLGEPTAAIYHLATHAFFKALLFLCAGSVIVALHHEQDIWKMGGLRNKMPVTFWTFAAATLAITGMPPFSGFYSKDSILTQAVHQHNLPLFILGVVVAVLTAFYMFRLMLVVFFGRERSEHAQHAHESPAVMVWPLRILALFSVIGGLIGIDTVLTRQFTPHKEVTPAFGQRLIEPFVHAPLVVVCSVLALLIGFTVAYLLYARADKDPVPEKVGPVAKWMRNKFYFDELYRGTVIRLHDSIAMLADWVDRWIIEGFCIGLVRGGTDFIGRALRLVQTGNLQTYSLLFVLGMAVVLWLVLGD